MAGFTLSILLLLHYNPLHTKHSKHSKHSHSNTQTLKTPKNSLKHPHPHPLSKTQALWVTHGGPLNTGLYVCLQWQQSEAIGTRREDYKGYNADVVRFIQQTWNETCQKGGTSKGGQGGSARYTQDTKIQQGSRAEWRGLHQKKKKKKGKGIGKWLDIKLRSHRGGSGTQEATAMRDRKTLETTSSITIRSCTWRKIGMDPVLDEPQNK